METNLDEIFDAINECDGGGCACGGDCGGGCGGDCGGGAGGIASGDVLGPGGAESGSGCMGPGDFHVPFPVMPCLFRWPNNWIGGSKKKRKKGKKTVTAKNPYAKGMKTIVAEDEGSFRYVGPAKEQFDKVVGHTDRAYTGVLNYNDMYKIAWMVRDDGILRIYKPMDVGPFWTVYATHLEDDGTIMLDYKAGKYHTEQDALNAVYKAAKEHEKKLNECLSEAEECEKTLTDARDKVLAKKFTADKATLEDAAAKADELKKYFKNKDILDALDKLSDCMRKKAGAAVAEAGKKKKYAAPALYVGAVKLIAWAYSLAGLLVKGSGWLLQRVGDIIIDGAKLVEPALLPDAD